MPSPHRLSSAFPAEESPSLLQGARPDEGTLAGGGGMEPPATPSPSLQMSQTIFSPNRAASQTQTPHWPGAELPVFMQLKH